MKKQLLSLSFLLFIAINAFAQTSDNTAFADTNSGENELLIQFKNAESRVNFTKNNAFFINNALFSIEKIVEDWEIYTLKLKKTVDKKTTSLLIDSLLINLKNDPNIACVQRNTAVSLRGITPNDTYFYGTRQYENYRCRKRVDIWHGRRNGTRRHDCRRGFRRRNRF